MVLTADRDTLIIAKPSLKGYPVLNDTTIYKGGMVCLGTTGYAIPATDTAGLKVLGVADETVISPASDDDGDKKIRVRSGEMYDFAATSITQAMLGDVMYVVDDETFDDAAGATNEVPAGILSEFISTTRGKIFIPTGGMSVDIPNLSVQGADLVAGILRVTLVAGGAAGNHTVAGIAVGDEIVFVGHFTTAASIATLGDLTSEFVAGAGVVTNTGGTDTTNDQLQVIWIDKT
jgi:hypothetical protein